MNSPYWIGISGKQGAGKSTLANKLKLVLEDNGYTVEIQPFAYTLKHIASLLERGEDILNEYMHLGLDIVSAQRLVNKILDAYKQYPTQPGIKNRALLQLLGEEYGRQAIHHNVWVNAAHARVMHTNCNVILADDVRYPNEVFIVDYHIHIDTDNSEEYINTCTRKGYAVNDTHTSETQELPRANLTIKAYSSMQIVVDNVVTRLNEV